MTLVKCAAIPLLALLLLSACAGVVPPAEEPPIAYPASLRDRLVDLALREWEAFGGGISDYRGPERVELRPSLLEEDPRVFHLVQGYWNAVREERASWPQHLLEQRAAYRSGSSDSWSEVPWSAAFISYLFRSAGVDEADFRWSAAHSFYLDHALQAQDRWGDLALYTPLDLQDHRPRPGDLVCQDRSRPVARRLAAVEERRRELGRFRPMHCDLVVDARPYRLSLVGGNLRNAVRLIYLPLDDGGYLRPWPAEEGSRASPFAILRLNVPQPMSGSLLSEAQR